MPLEKMTSLQRVMTTLSHKTPDRVPFFLLLSMHGAKELGLSIQEYFSKAEYVVEGQLIMRAKYRHDCLNPFFYAPIEIEAWGGEVIYSKEGPPNSGAPIIQHFEDIKKLTPPEINNSSCLNKVLQAIRMLKRKVKDDAPIIGVVMSPFSLPVMQMGFDKYIELIYEHTDLFKLLMQVNEEFCVNWANAQFTAGASAICYFDPVSSPTVSTRETYLKTGFETAKRIHDLIEGPTATHMASGICLPVADLFVQTGTAAIATSAQEDLADVKRAFKNKLAVIGNLNGISMRRWTVEEAEEKVKNALAKAGEGGGFILADNHGEIPWQVPEEVLMAISKAVHTWGHYPMEWITKVEEQIEGHNL